MAHTSLSIVVPISGYRIVGILILPLTKRNKIDWPGWEKCKSKSMHCVVRQIDKWVRAVRLNRVPVRDLQNDTSSLSIQPVRILSVNGLLFLLTSGYADRDPAGCSII